MGKITYKDEVHAGEHPAIVDEAFFERVQWLLKRNGRSGGAHVMNRHGALLKGLVRCKACGCAMAPSHTVRRHASHGTKVYRYYCCTNAQKRGWQVCPSPSVPARNSSGSSSNRSGVSARTPTCWPRRSERAVASARRPSAILREFETFRLPDPRTVQWFHDAVAAAFDDVGAARAARKKMLTKRRTELTNMQDRLLNGYLAGKIDEAAFQAKSADLKAQSEDVGRQLDEVGDFDSQWGRAALAVLDFSQKLPEIWHGSNSAQKRAVLECVSLNRALSDVSLCLEKRKPFDLLAKRAFLEKTRGDWI